MLRAPFSLEKTSYDASSGTVTYRSRLHATLKRNFQLMPGVQWLALLCKHIPDRHEHLVRYSSRTRGALPVRRPSLRASIPESRPRRPRPRVLSNTTRKEVPIFPRAACAICRSWTRARCSVSFPSATW